MSTLATRTALPDLSITVEGNNSRKSELRESAISRSIFTRGTAACSNEKKTSMPTKNDRGIDAGQTRSRLSVNYCCEKQYTRARARVCVSGCGVGRCVAVRESCREHRLQGSYLRATLATRVTLPQVHPRVVVFSSLHAACTKLYATMEHDAAVPANEFRGDFDLDRERERETER